MVLLVAMVSTGHRLMVEFHLGGNFLALLAESKHEEHFMYQDRELACRDCGNPFTFTVGEQEFYASKGLENTPRRCPECRRAYKSGRTEGGRSAGTEGGRSAGSGYASAGGYGGGYERSPRQLTDATCAQCGAPTQVPFVPRGDRPVYCSDCYAQMRSNSSSYSGSR
jgi:CxxC-x17-CxxC domain-containing protein